MMMAALQGGLTFQKGLGAVHALSHPLGGLKEPSLHHGTLNAVILPTVLRFNEPAAPEKYRILRRTLGLAETASLPAFFAALTARLGLPPSLRTMGVPESCLATIAHHATLDHSAATNPRPASEAEFLALLREAMG
jgi:alcohol dehydrogenase class IV